MKKISQKTVAISVVEDSGVAIIRLSSDLEQYLVKNPICGPSDYSGLPGVENNVHSPWRQFSRYGTQYGQTRVLSEETRRKMEESRLQQRLKREENRQKKALKRILHIQRKESEIESPNSQKAEDETESSNVIISSPVKKKYSWNVFPYTPSKAKKKLVITSANVSTVVADVDSNTEVNNDCDSADETKCNVDSLMAENHENLKYLDSSSPEVSKRTPLKTVLVKSTHKSNSKRKCDDDETWSVDTEANWSAISYAKKKSPKQVRTRKKERLNYSEIDDPDGDLDEVEYRFSPASSTKSGRRVIPVSRKLEDAIVSASMTKSSKKRKMEHVTDDSATKADSGVDKSSVVAPVSNIISAFHESQSAVTSSLPNPTASEALQNCSSLTVMSSADSGTPFEESTSKDQTSISASGKTDASQSASSDSTVAQTTEKKDKVALPPNSLLHPHLTHQEKQQNPPPLVLPAQCPPPPAYQHPLNFFSPSFDPSTSTNPQIAFHYPTQPPISHSNSSSMPSSSLQSSMMTSSSSSSSPLAESHFLNYPKHVNSSLSKTPTTSNRQLNNTVVSSQTAATVAQTTTAATNFVQSSSIHSHPHISPHMPNLPPCPPPLFHPTHPSLFPHHSNVHIPPPYLSSQPQLPLPMSNSSSSVVTTISTVPTPKPSTTASISAPIITASVNAPIITTLYPSSQHAYTRPLLDGYGMPVHVQHYVPQTLPMPTLQSSMHANTQAPASYTKNSTVPSNSAQKQRMPAHTSPASNHPQTHNMPALTSLTSNHPQKHNMPAHTSSASNHLQTHNMPALTSLTSNHPQTHNMPAHTSPASNHPQMHNMPALTSPASNHPQTYNMPALTSPASNHPQTHNMPAHTSSAINHSKPQQMSTHSSVTTAKIIVNNTWPVPCLTREGAVATLHQNTSTSKPSVAHQPVVNRAPQGNANRMPPLIRPGHNTLENNPMAPPAAHGKASNTIGTNRQTSRMAVENMLTDMNNRRQNTPRATPPSKDSAPSSLANSSQKDSKAQSLMTVETMLKNIKSAYEKRVEQDADRSSGSQSQHETGKDKSSDSVARNSNSNQRERKRQSSSSSSSSSQSPQHFKKTHQSTQRGNAQSGNGVTSPLDLSPYPTQSFIQKQPQCRSEGKYSNSQITDQSQSQLRMAAPNTMHMPHVNRASSEGIRQQQGQQGLSSPNIPSKPRPSPKTLISQQQHHIAHMGDQQPLPQHPSQRPVPQHPSQQPAPQRPSQQPAPQHPSQQPAPQRPSQQPAPQRPSQQPVSQHPSQQPVSQHPSQQPVSQHPSQQPVSQHPSQQPVSQHPSQQPVSQHPSQRPVSQHPSQQPVSQHPSQQPVPLNSSQNCVPPNLPRQSALANPSRQPSNQFAPPYPSQQLEPSNTSQQSIPMVDPLMNKINVYSQFNLRPTSSHFVHGTHSNTQQQQPQRCSLPVSRPSAIPPSSINEENSSSDNVNATYQQNPSTPDHTSSSSSQSRDGSTSPVDSKASFILQRQRQMEDGHAHKSTYDNETNSGISHRPSASSDHLQKGSENPRSHADSKMSLIIQRHLQSGQFQANAAKSNEIPSGSSNQEYSERESSPVDSKMALILQRQQRERQAENALLITKPLPSNERESQFSQSEVSAEKSNHIRSGSNQNNSESLHPRPHGRVRSPVDSKMALQRQLKQKQAEDGPIITKPLPSNDRESNSPFQSQQSPSLAPPQPNSSFSSSLSQNQDVSPSKMSLLIQRHLQQRQTDTAQPSHSQGSSLTDREAERQSPMHDHQMSHKHQTIHTCNAKVMQQSQSHPDPSYSQARLETSPLITSSALLASQSSDVPVDSKAGILRNIKRDISEEWDEEDDPHDDEEGMEDDYDEEDEELWKPLDVKPNLKELQRKMKLEPGVNQTHTTSVVCKSLISATPYTATTTASSPTTRAAVLSSPSMTTIPPSLSVTSSPSSIAANISLSTTSSSSVQPMPPPAVTTAASTISVTAAISSLIVVSSPMPSLTSSLPSISSSNRDASTNDKRSGSIKITLGTSNSLMDLISIKKELSSCEDNETREEDEEEEEYDSFSIPAEKTNRLSTQERNDNCKTDPQSQLVKPLCTSSVISASHKLLSTSKPIQALSVVTDISKLSTLIGSISPAKTPSVESPVVVGLIQSLSDYRDRIKEKSHSPICTLSLPQPSSSQLQQPEQAPSQKTLPKTPVTMSGNSNLSPHHMEVNEPMALGNVCSSPSSIYSPSISLPTCNLVVIPKYGKANEKTPDSHSFSSDGSDNATETPTPFVSSEITTNDSGSLIKERICPKLSEDEASLQGDEAFTVRNSEEVTPKIVSNVIGEEPAKLNAKPVEDSEVNNVSSADIDSTKLTKNTEESDSIVRLSSNENPPEIINSVQTVKPAGSVSLYSDVNNARTDSIANSAENDCVESYPECDNDKFESTVGLNTGTSVDNTDKSESTVGLNTGTSCDNTDKSESTVGLNTGTSCDNTDKSESTVGLDAGTSCDNTDKSESTVGLNTGTSCDNTGKSESTVGLDAGTSCDNTDKSESTVGLNTGTSCDNTDKSESTVGLNTGTSVDNTDKSESTVGLNTGTSCDITGMSESTVGLDTCTSLDNVNDSSTSAGSVVTLIEESNSTDNAACQQGKQITQQNQQREQIQPSTVCDTTSLVTDCQGIRDSSNGQSNASSMNLKGDAPGTVKNVGSEESQVISVGPVEGVVLGNESQGTVCTGDVSVAEDDTRHGNDNSLPLNVPGKESSVASDTNNETAFPLENCVPSRDQLESIAESASSDVIKEAVVHDTSGEKPAVGEAIEDSNNGSMEIENSSIENDVNMPQTNIENIPDKPTDVQKAVGMQNIEKVVNAQTESRNIFSVTLEQNECRDCEKVMDASGDAGSQHRETKDCANETSSSAGNAGKEISNSNSPNCVSGEEERVGVGSGQDSKEREFTDRSGEMSIGENLVGRSREVSGAEAHGVHPVDGGGSQVCEDAGEIGDVVNRHVEQMDVDDGLCRGGVSLANTLIVSVDGSADNNTEKDIEMREEQGIDGDACSKVVRNSTIDGNADKSVETREGKGNDDDVSSQVVKDSTLDTASGNAKTTEKDIEMRGEEGIIGDAVGKVVEDSTVASVSGNADKSMEMREGKGNGGGDVSSQVVKDSTMASVSVNAETTENDVEMRGETGIVGDIRSKVVKESTVVSMESSCDKNPDKDFQMKDQNHIDVNLSSKVVEDIMVISGNDSGDESTEKTTDMNEEKGNKCNKDIEIIEGVGDARAVCVRVDTVEVIDIDDEEDDDLAKSILATNSNAVDLSRTISMSSSSNQQSCQATPGVASVANVRLNPSVTKGLHINTSANVVVELLDDDDDDVVAITQTNLPVTTDTNNTTTTNENSNRNSGGKKSSSKSKSSKNQATSNSVVEIISSDEEEENNSEISKEGAGSSTVIAPSSRLSRIFSASDDGMSSRSSLSPLSSPSCSGGVVSRCIQSLGLWTKSQVSHWLATNKLDKICLNLTNLDGPGLQRMAFEYHRNPEVFYVRVKKSLGLTLFQTLVIERSLKSLIHSLMSSDC